MFGARESSVIPDNREWGLPLPYILLKLLKRLFDL